MKNKIKTNGRRMTLMAIDFVIVMISSCISYLLLNNMGSVTMKPAEYLSVSALYAVGSVVFMLFFGTYKIIWRYADFKELINCAFSVMAGWFAVSIPVILSNMWLDYPETQIVFSYLTSVFMIVSSRITYRRMYSYAKSQQPVEKTIRTMVVGAGYAGHIIVNEMLRPQSKYLPVVIVDDDSEKKGRYIHGVKIDGNIADIPYITKKYEVSNIVIAIPSCGAKSRKRILEFCKQTDCEIKILPYMHEMTMGKNLLEQTKKINIEDLLGRDPVKFEQDDIKALINGKICLVTGGGGSIGSELSRQIASNNPKQLIIVDIYENNAYEIQQELIRKYGDSLDLQVRIASVRDYDKIKALFDEFRPQLVFHAAAHKHVPLMEDSPSEAIKNNIFGTYSVATVSEEYNVEKFVLVSTDKAVNPTNVMGATKRCCELIIEYMKQKTSGNTEYVAVRFGNVLGSNGSVVPLFEEQIKSGGPVTVTHPDIIRYFMTIPEATSLILQAAGFARGGEIFVLDMGEPVKILSLAENVIRMKGKRPYEDVKIEFTGLRPGEKLYEELLMSEEGLKKTINNKIFIGQQTEIDVEKFDEQLKELRRVADLNENEKCVEVLEKVVPTFVRAKTAVK